MTELSRPTAPLLELTDLSVELRVGGAWHPILDQVSLELHDGETLGLVGESGSGKTLTALSLLGLLGSDRFRITDGALRVGDETFTDLSPSRLQALRGRQIGMIFQEPRRALDPYFTVGSQIAQSARVGADLSRKEAWARAVELLEHVGIVNPERSARQYPHSMSGGMCQRVMLAVALASNPRVLIADEPTTSLDVTVQAEMLALLARLQREREFATLFITHDLGVVAEICDRVAVMYAGRTVEAGPVAEVFHAPTHPYTSALLRSVPQVGSGTRRFTSIPGFVPSPTAWPDGCRFHPRCDHATDRCRETVPLLAGPSSHLSSCVRVGELSLEGVR